MLAACLGVSGLAAAPDRYVNDFSAAEVDKPPQDVQVVNGAFAVAEVDRNKVLELPGNPLDTFGLLFGPPAQAEVTVAARVQGESTGRRFPEFGVGAGDVGGYKVVLLPAQKRVELRKGDDVVAGAGYGWDWTSGTWTTLVLRVSKAGDGRWKVHAKVWPSGWPEPAGWSVSADVAESPGAGRASLWAAPFSGKPIRFDDLHVTPG